MGWMLCAALFLFSACSKPPEADTSGPVVFVRSDNGAVMQAGTASAPVTAAERMEIFGVMKSPVTPGNPYEFRVCAVLSDKDGKPVAADGQFAVESALASGGEYVYAHKFGPLSLPGRSEPLGICPKSSQLGAGQYQSGRGKTFPLAVSFKTASGKTISASTNFSY